MAIDSSGNNHTGTLGAGVTWSAGNVGSHAISLAGTANGVVTVVGPVIDTAGSFTASAWVKLSSLTGYQTVVSIAGNTVAGFFLQLRADTGSFAFTRLLSDANTAATYVSAPTAPVVGTWYHIVGVNDTTAGTIALYVDGRSIGTATYTAGWRASGNTLIGHGFYNGGDVDFVNGSIDDVQLFNTALSAEQVAALDQPAAYSFDDGEGGTAADVSGHGHILNLGSGAGWAAGRLGSNSLALFGSSLGTAAYPGPVVNTALSFSVSAWVKLNSLTVTQSFVSIDGSTTSAFYLQLRGDTGKFAFTRLAADSDAAAPIHADALAVPAIGKWYNLIGVNDVAAGRLLLYVDGVLQASVAYSGGWQGIGATVVGSGMSGGARTQFADARIDEVRFYNSPLSAEAATFIGTAGSATINIAMGSTGLAVSPDLYGAFMEDINYGGEGGIYSNEVRNSGFNDSTNPLNAWTAVAASGVTAALTSDATTGPTAALSKSGKLTITSGVTSSTRAGIANSGYFGVALAPSTTYTVEFYAKATANFTGPLTVTLESSTGAVYASATVSSISGAWAKYSVALTTGASTPTSAANRLVIATNSASANGATIWFGAVYCFPPGFDGGSNHFRSDLMQWLVDLHPAIFRVPGGNYLEGSTYADRFNWSQTIGPIENRPGHFNSAWGYWSTDGLGLDEYLEMAELMGAEPVLAVYAGYTLNGSSDTGAVLANDVTDALNELHYVLDPITTSWGALRAANGHPAPYNVNYVEIGNEDWFSTTYPERYPLFYDAIRTQFPSLQIIATSSSTGGRPYDVLDDHFYNSPQWFLANSHYYDNAMRGNHKIFVGEYAAREGTTTDTMIAALGDAAWLMGLERNSDLVIMSSYAPLWVNESSYQWSTNLIGFNNTSSYGSPSFYVQAMLSQNRGANLVSNSVAAANGLQTLVTKTGSTYYVTVINPMGTANSSTINLIGAASVSPTANVKTLAASAGNAVNSLANPTNIVPAASTFAGLGTTFNYSFPAYSLTILEFTATIDTPTVATVAAASPSPVTGTSTNLSVLGADIGGEALLTYEWSASGPSDVSFSSNNNNGAKNTVATFSQAGTYVFAAKITNSASGASVISSVVVTVAQTAVGVAVLPANTTVAAGATAQLTAAIVDQFGDPMPAQPAFTWSITSGVGSVNAAGLYTSPLTGGAARVHATSTAGGADANITVAVPLAWYRADSTSGTSLVDASGNGKTGTLTGTTGWSAGVGGNSLALNGGRANLPAGVVSGLNDFTIATWFKINTLSAWSRVFDFGTSTSVNMFLTPQANGAGGPLRFAITTGGGGGEQRIDGPTLAAGQWYHVAVTLAGDMATMYVDGVPVATYAGMTTHPAALGNTTRNWLGDSQYSSDPSFVGLVDDFRIYSAALPEQQIRQLARPTIVVPAAAPSESIVGTSTSLSIVATDSTAGESALVYMWSSVGTSPGPVTFSANGTNAAKNTTASFVQPGVYQIEVTIANPIAGLTTTSSMILNVTVLPGDYSNNGIVDAADFVIWRKNIGSMILVNRGGDITGPVGQPDYDVWRSNFGATRPAVAATSITDPQVTPPVELQIQDAVSEWAPERTFEHALVSLVTEGLVEVRIPSSAITLDPNNNNNRKATRTAISRFSYQDILLLALDTVDHKRKSALAGDTKPVGADDSSRERENCDECDINGLRPFMRPSYRRITI
ncbi:MAG: LamG-like jellyroll fold domain-containing protein [Pirellulales bacterium]